MFFSSSFLAVGLFLMHFITPSFWIQVLIIENPYIILSSESINQSTMQFIDIFIWLWDKVNHYHVVYIASEIHMNILLLPHSHILQLIRLYTTKRPIIREWSILGSTTIVKTSLPKSTPYVDCFLFNCPWKHDKVSSKLNQYIYIELKILYKWLNEKKV